jgi:hypothetical protein
VSDHGPKIRASDDERSAVADTLRSHWVAGRLEAGELEQRLNAALSAHTVSELERLVEDLPGEHSVPARNDGSAPAKVKPGLPGLRRFRQAHELPVDRDLAFCQALEYILPVMVADGFNVIGRVDQELLRLRASRRTRRRLVSPFPGRRHSPQGAREGTTPGS